MLGFAVIDSHPDGNEMAIWLTTRHAALVDHTNAVVVARDAERRTETCASMTADRIVLLTPGTTLETDPAPMTFDDLRLFEQATEDLYDQVADAIAAYGKKTRNKSLVTPPRPQPCGYTEPAEDTAPGRALATANYLARLWQNWLTVEEERRRRTVSPRTEATPWIMPPDLNSATTAELPDAVAAFEPVPVRAS